MTIAAKIIADSYCPRSQKRIITMELEYPRFIHAEFMTHRMFSRNASSSRAIPVSKMIENIKKDIAMPIHWGQNQPGMQARTELSKDDKQRAVKYWLEACNQALIQAQHMHDIGAHKQIVNRILEPFMHIKVIVTATEWKNFFVLRDHQDAQPEIRELAIQMKKAIDTSVSKPLPDNYWHLPYVDDDDFKAVYEHMKKGRITRDEPPMKDQFMMLCAVSAARCARVSYLTHNGQKPTIEQDLELYKKLVMSEPPHMSPCEHQATPDLWHNGAFVHPELSGNFVGWIQFRHLIQGESVKG